jgi:folate-binding protein YgfZ
VGAVGGAYETARTRWGFRPRRDRVLFRVEGERRVEMLDGILTNDLKRAPPDRALWALLLTPKGRIVADLRVLPRPDELWLEVPAVAAERLAATFQRYLPPRFARATVWAEGAVLDVYGPAAAEAVRAATGVEPPSEPPRVAALDGETGPAVVVAHDDLRLPGYTVAGARAALEPIGAALHAHAERTGGAPLDDAAFDALRIEAGWPRYGQDVTEENLVQETGWESRAVSFTKGCYLGQEVVIRVHHRGHPNRYLRGLRLPEPLPLPGSTLYADGKPVGTVTSTARSPRLGPIGLGYVRREVAPGARVRVGDPEAGAEAEVLALPFPE